MQLKVLAILLMTPGLVKAMDLCAVIDATERRLEMTQVHEAYSFKALNSNNETLSVEATPNEVLLSISGVQKSFVVQSRLSTAEFSLLKRRFVEQRENFWGKNSENQRQLQNLVSEVMLESAFYGSGANPIKAGRELVKLLERTTQSGGRRVKVEFKTDGIPTTREQIEAWSRLATTLHEIVERRIVDQVAEGVAQKRREQAAELEQQNNRNILDNILNDGRPAQREVSLQNAIDATVKDPNAVEILVTNFLDSVDSGPLTIKIERGHKGLQVKVSHSYGEAKSLADIASRISSFAKDHWRTYERLPSNPF